MKKLLFLFSFVLFYSFYSPLKTLAQVPPCDPVTGTECTYCNYDANLDCIVDYNLSCKPPAVPPEIYYPDVSLCTNAHCLTGQPVGNCLDTPNCGNNGDSCTGIGQGNCCSSNPPLLCVSGICTQQTTCTPVGEFCIGPAGTPGGCCNPLVCDVWQVGDPTLKCRIPKVPIGFFCETSQAQCLPCYQGDTYFGCSPVPEYTDYAVCDSACKGHTPKKFTCTNNQCVESETGIYSNIADCTASCEVNNSDGVQLFCGDQTGTVRTAIGCIKAGNPRDLINQIVTWTISLAAGLSLLSLVYAGFVMTTAGADSARVREARESITSTLLGLAIIVVATVILNFLGIRLLGLGVMGFGV